MKPTDELSQEHDAMLRMIRVVTEMAHRLEAGIDVETDDLGRAVEFIRSFSDACHHIKEEDHLYAEVVRMGSPDERPPIDLMIAEHEEGRKHVETMARAVDALRKGDRKAGRSFAAAARRYGTLLTEHIFKEDHVLYPMLRSRLTTAQQTMLKVHFADIDRNCLGASRRAEFVRVLEQLERAYPE